MYKDQPTPNRRPSSIDDIGYVSAPLERGEYLPYDLSTRGLEALPGRLIDITAVSQVDEQDIPTHTSQFSIANLGQLPGKLSREIRGVDPKPFTDQIAIACPAYNSPEERFYEIAQVISHESLVRELPICIDVSPHLPPAVSYGPPKDAVRKATRIFFNSLNDSRSIHPMFNTNQQTKRPCFINDDSVDWTRTGQALPALDPLAITHALEALREGSYNPQTQHLLELFPNRHNPNDIFVRTLEKYILPKLTPSEHNTGLINPDDPNLKEAFIYSLIQSTALELYKQDMSPNQSLQVVGVNDDGTMYVDTILPNRAPRHTETKIDSDSHKSYIPIGYIEGDALSDNIPSISGVIQKHNITKNDNNGIIIMRVNETNGSIAEYADSTFQPDSFYYPKDLPSNAPAPIIDNIINGKWSDEYAKKIHSTRRLGNIARTLVLLGESKTDFPRHNDNSITYHSLLGSQEIGVLSMSELTDKNPVEFFWTTVDNSNYNHGNSDPSSLLSITANKAGRPFVKVHRPELLHIEPLISDQLDITAPVRAPYGLDKAALRVLRDRLKNSSGVPATIDADNLSDAQLIEAIHTHGILRAPLASLGWTISKEEVKSPPPTIINPNDSCRLIPSAADFELANIAPGAIAAATFNHEGSPSLSFYILNKHSYVGINQLRHEEIANQYHQISHQPLYISSSATNGSQRDQSTLLLNPSEGVGNATFIPVYAGIERRSDGGAYMSIQSSIASFEDPIALARVTYDFSSESLVIDNLPLDQDSSPASLELITHINATTEPHSPETYSALQQYESASKITNKPHTPIEPSDKKILKNVAHKRLRPESVR